MTDKQKELLTQLVSLIAASEEEKTPKKVAAVADSTDKGAMESKKFRALMLGLAVTLGSMFLTPLAMHYGVSDTVVEDVFQTISTLGGIYLGAQGVTDMASAFRKKQS
jgi:threonine/homoserine/homoserine lactone efflux protein